MAYPSGKIVFVLDIGILVYRPSTSRGLADRVAEGAAVYPRHPERTAFYRVLEAHLDRYLGTHTA